jgi:hypothetical protein
VGESILCIQNYKKANSGAKKQIRGKVYKNIKVVKNQIAVDNLCVDL